MSFNAYQNDIIKNFAVVISVVVKRVDRTSRFEQTGYTILYCVRRLLGESYQCRTYPKYLGLD